MLALVVAAATVLRQAKLVCDQSLTGSGAKSEPNGTRLRSIVSRSCTRSRRTINPTAFFP
jgi:hypothetical protein